jgi:hypothetical protein
MGRRMAVRLTAWGLLELLRTSFRHRPAAWRFAVLTDAEDRNMFREMRADA